MRISRSAAGLAAAACLVVLTAGCGADSGAGDRHQPHTRRHRYRGTVSACQHAGHDDGAGQTAPGSQVPRCHTSQLSAAYTGLNAAMVGAGG